MTKTLSILLSVAAISASAQTATPTASVRVVTPTPVQPTVPSRTIGPRILLPNQPGLRTTLPGVGAISNNGAAAGRFAATNANAMALSNSMVYSNLFGWSNMDLPQVATSLQTLQQNIEELLPALTTLSGRLGGSVGTTATPTGTTAANLGSAGVGTVNPGATAPPMTSTAPSQNASRTSPFLPASPFLRATGNPSQGVQQGNSTTANTAATGQATIGTLGPNAFQTDAQTRQMLITLQANLQQALPIIRALNTGNASGTVNQQLTPSIFVDRFSPILQEQDIPTGDQTIQSGQMPETGNQ